jgi:hypothetical protein
LAKPRSLDDIVVSVEGVEFVARPISRAVLASNNVPASIVGFRVLILRSVATDYESRVKYGFATVPPGCVSGAPAPLAAAPRYLRPKRIDLNQFFKDRRVRSSALELHHFPLAMAGFIVSGRFDVFPFELAGRPMCSAFFALEACQTPLALFLDTSVPSRRYISP